ncbi:hypothetical protein JB92DRAFT_3115324 [Gautieria morchelliformis]|nr:hypothetical protein JB92DRAFT_3115324 [Gautieria morchelliformis]
MAVLYKNGKELKSMRPYMGPESEHMVFEAEVAGAAMGAKMLNMERSSKYTVALDNQAAIQMTRRESVISGQYLVNAVHRQIQGVVQQQAGAKVVMRWVPGHEGVEGNKRVDEEAKKAVKGETSEESQIPIECQGVLLISRAAENQRHNAELKRSAQETFTKLPRARFAYEVDPTMPIFYSQLLSLPNPSLAYITNDIGTSVNGYQAKDMRQTAHHLFASLHDAGYALKSWSRAPFNAVEYFPANMYKHYPDLCLCEGHWKLNLFASQEYPAFTHALKNRGNDKEEPESDNSLSPTPETPKKCIHASSDKPALNVKKTKVNHPVPGTAGPGSGSTCAVAIPTLTSKGSPIVSLTSSSEMFSTSIPSSDLDFTLHTIPALLDTLYSTLPVSILPSASAPLPLSLTVQPLKSTIKDNLPQLISASPLTPNEATDIPGNAAPSSNPSVGNTTAMLKQPEASAQIINPFAQHIHVIPKVNLRLPEPPPPTPSLNNASKGKKNLDDASTLMMLAFEGLSAQEKKVYADRGAYNKKNNLPPQLDLVDASKGSLDDKQSREVV